MIAELGRGENYNVLRYMAPPGRLHPRQPPVSHIPKAGQGRDAEAVRERGRRRDGKKGM